MHGYIEILYVLSGSQRVEINEKCTSYIRVMWH
ncbi:hypothetical protein [Paenibacillus sp. USHLN196]